MTTKPVVELLRKELDASLSDDLRHGCRYESPGDGKDGYAYGHVSLTALAEGLVAALDAAGYAFVPKEPSEKMHLEFTDRMRLSHRLGYSDFCMGYYAMLAAAAEDQL